MSKLPENISQGCCTKRDMDAAVFTIGRGPFRAVQGLGPYVECLILGVDYLGRYNWITCSGGIWILPPPSNNWTMSWFQLNRLLWVGISMVLCGRAQNNLISKICASECGSKIA